MFKRKAARIKNGIGERIEEDEQVEKGSRMRISCLDATFLL